jgi:very-short-patch-repair endonuclease
VKDNLFLLRWSKLYANPTDAEVAIEPAIASLGVRYRFQHPLFGLRLFPDFILPDYRLVIEVDDRSHFTKKKREADAERTERLNSGGWRVVRCTNDEAEEDPYGAVDKMMEEAGLNFRTRREPLKES